jgi:1,4-dihydroxy-2-naphthoyl-CoA hydrolase
VTVQGSIAFTITERTDERVVAEMPIAAGIQNPYGVVHAGAMLWMADVTATLLVMGPERPTEGGTGFPLAINLNASFLANQREGSLKAVATYVKRGRMVSVVRTIVSGADEKLIADVTTSHVLAK